MSTMKYCTVCKKHCRIGLRGMDTWMCEGCDSPITLRRGDRLPTSPVIAFTSKINQADTYCRYGNKCRHVLIGVCQYKHHKNETPCKWGLDCRGKCQYRHA